MTDRIGAITTQFFSWSFKACKVEIRLATVSLLGLKRSCGNVSQAGNSKVSACNSLISLNKSSAALDEAVITKIGFLSARNAIK